MLAMPADTNEINYADGDGISDNADYVVDGPKFSAN